MPHTKMIYVAPTESQDGWLYMGSHNCSAAAMGKLQKNNTQLHVLNYEIGVILEMKKGQTATALPFGFPATKYNADQQPFVSDS